MQAMATSHVFINTERKMLDSDFVLVPKVVLSSLCADLVDGGYLMQTVLGKKRQDEDSGQNLGKLKKKRGP